MNKDKVFNSLSDGAIRPTFVKHTVNIFKKNDEMEYYNFKFRFLLRPAQQKLFEDAFPL